MMAKLGELPLLALKSTTWTPPASADQLKSVVVLTPVAPGAGRTGSAGMGSASDASLVPGATPASDPKIWTDPVGLVAMVLTRTLRSAPLGTSTEKVVPEDWSEATGKKAPSGKVT